MKKNRVPILLLVSLLVFFSININAIAEEIRNGKVVSVYRDSYLYDAETKDVVKIRIGTRVTPGDFITTEGNSTLVIDFDGDRLYVSPSSVVEVLENKNSTTLKFYRGKLYIVVKERSNDSQFIVKTKSSSIETKGANFSVAEIVNEIPKDDPDWEFYLKEAAKPDDDPSKFRAISVEIKTVVVKGSVTVSPNLEVEKKDGEFTVEIKKNEKYIIRDGVYYRFGE